jgi:hypothetical protein
MRIPLNTVINQCFVIKALWKNFREVIDEHEKNINPKLKLFMEMIYEEVNERSQEMSTMGNLL